MIAKGVVNHASKAYEFSHFFTYSPPFQDPQLVKEEGKSILRKPFAHNNVSYDDLDLEFECEDQADLDIHIENEVQADPDTYLLPTLNPRPK